METNINTESEKKAKLDFSKTSPQGEGNFQAPLAVTKAAVLYVFRCLLDDDIPLNAGCFKPLELIIPKGCLLNPHPPAAVAARHRLRLLQGAVRAQRRRAQGRAVVQRAGRGGRCRKGLRVGARGAERRR